jgi:hypothetical protein
MSPYMIYQMVQAEQAEQRARYGAGQRQADAQLGELAAAVAQGFRTLGFRTLGRPTAAVRAALRRGRRGEAVMDQ